MTFSRPTLDELSRQSETEITSRLGTGPVMRRSVIGVLARVMAGLTHSLHGHLAWIARQILPDTATAENLERLGSLKGVERKAATFAEGEAELTGSPGSVIPVGLRLQRADGLTYTTTAARAISDEAQLVPVIAETPGGAGNAPFGTQIQLTSPALGLDSAGILREITGGEDTETDEELRPRVLEAYRRQPDGGTEADYERWALEVPGITRAFAFGRNPTLGQVTVYVLADGNSGSPEPTGTQLEDVRAYINARRPVAARVNVRTPQIQALALVVEMVPESNRTQADAQRAVEALLLRTSRPGAVVRLSQISEAISATAGEDHHRIVSPAADVETPADAVLQAEAITWV